LSFNLNFFFNQAISTYICSKTSDAAFSIRQYIDILLRIFWNSLVAKSNGATIVSLRQTQFDTFVRHFATLY